MTNEQGNKIGKFKKIENVTTPIICLGVIFILFILSFSIGVTEIVVTMRSGSFSSSAETTVAIAEDNVFYFLGYSFKDIYELFDNWKYNFNYASFMSNLNAVYGICMALVIVNFVVQLVGLVFGAFSMVKAIRSGDRRTLNMFTAMSFVSFLLLSLTLYGTSYNRVVNKNALTLITVSTGTLTGISLSLFLLVVAIMLTNVAKGKKYFCDVECKKIISVSFVSLFAIMALFFNNSEYFIVRNIVVDREMAFSALLFFISINNGVTMVNFSQVEGAITSSTITLYSHIATSLALAFIILFAIYVLLHGNTAKTKLFIVTSISVAVVSIFNLVMAIITNGQLMPSQINNMGERTIGYGVFVTTALSLLVCVFSIVYAKIKSKKAQEVEEQN